MRGMADYSWYWVAMVECARMRSLDHGAWSSSGLAMEVCSKAEERLLSAIGAGRTFARAGKAMVADGDCAVLKAWLPLAPGQKRAATLSALVRLGGAGAPVEGFEEMGALIGRLARSAMGRPMVVERAVASLLTQIEQGEAEALLDGRLWLG